MQSNSAISAWALLPCALCAVAVGASAAMLFCGAHSCTSSTAAAAAAPDAATRPAAPLDSRAASVLELWFGGDLSANYKQKWFPNVQAQASMDAHLIEHYSQLLHQAEAGALAHWEQQPRTLLALIVVLDQFSRHVYRHKERALIDANDAKALMLCNCMLDRGWDSALSPPERMFALMPLRHCRREQEGQVVLERIAALSSELEAHAALLGKFERASVKSLQLIRGKQAQQAAVSSGVILEKEELDLDLEAAGVRKHALFRVMDAFLKERRVRELGVVCVSLSGGVDSMVIASLLCEVRKSNRHGQFTVAAVHLDYGNRDESHAEAAYLQGWCDKHGIELHTLTIDGMRRANTDRDEYERRSREMRYQAYTDTLARYKCPAVMFGHHCGDVQENVISNCMRGQSLLQLEGMALSSVVNGVTVWRPLMMNDKKIIYDYAHKFGVPYFLDTTPTWATRGKLRNQLVPLLQDMYGDGVLKNLSKMGEQSTQLAELVNESLLRPFLASVVRTPVCVWVDLRPHLKQPLFFWKEGLRHMMHGASLSMFGDKAVGQLLNRVRPRAIVAKKARRKAEQEGSQPGVGVPNEWIALHRNSMCRLQDGCLVVCFPHAFTPPALVSAANYRGANRKERAEMTLAQQQAEEKAELQRRTALKRAPVLLPGQSFELRPWCVAVSEVQEAGSAREWRQPPLQLFDIFRGEFSYRLAWTDAEDKLLSAWEGGQQRREEDEQGAKDEGGVEGQANGQQEQRRRRQQQQQLRGPLGVADRDVAPGDAAAALRTIDQITISHVPLVVPRLSTVGAKDRGLQRQLLEAVDEPSTSKRYVEVTFSFCGSAEEGPLPFRM